MTTFTPRPQWVVDLINELAGTGGGTWGAISGTLSNQTDLQAALDAKVDDSQISSFGASLIDDADAAAARTTLGLGTAATLSTSDIDERARDAVGTALVAGSNITITPNDGADTITIAATGGIASGTSFPGSPATNDRFFRTDRGIEYFYNGTRWLSTQLLTQIFSPLNSITASSTLYMAMPTAVATQLWLEDVAWAVFINAGSAEWDGVLEVRTSANVATNVATINGAGYAASTWISANQACDYLWDNSTHPICALVFTEVSGAASLTGSATLTYRLVG